jgi:uncharacterized repeat protein (TIGR03803 family)
MTSMGAQYIRPAELPNFQNIPSEIPCSREFGFASFRVGAEQTVAFSPLFFCAIFSVETAAPDSGLTYMGEASGQPYNGTSPLYGTTPYGGTNGQGTVYEVMPKVGTRKWSETVLYSFCSQANCADRQQPEAPPYVDNAGNLYGTTNGGPDNQGGTVFELSSNGDSYAETTLYSFCAQANCTDGKSHTRTLS